MVKSIRRCLTGLVWLAGALSCLGLSACAGSTAAPRATVQTPRVSGTASVGPLRIERVELRFDNGFGGISVPRNSPLAANASLRFAGSGLLRAQWQVDGRPVEQVNLTLGRGALLQLPLAAPLPTFEPGPHELSLVIFEPRVNFGLPTLRYMVTADAAAE